MFAKIKDNKIIKYPYTLSDLYEDNPHTNFGIETNVAEIFPNTEAATLYGYTLVKVIDEPIPAINPNKHRIEPMEPKLLEGVWVRKWQIVDKTEEELAKDYEDQAKIIRIQRNTLLRDSDWTQGKDIPDDVSQTWAIYRQFLRDIPQQDEFPWNVIWPVVPS